MKGVSFQERAEEPEGGSGSLQDVLQPFKYQKNVLQSIRMQKKLKLTCQELLYCTDGFVI